MSESFFKPEDFVDFVPVPLVGAVCARANEKLLFYFRSDEGNREYLGIQILASALRECEEALPNIPPDCGSHTHKGLLIDHKDCDAIREYWKKWNLK